jgi:hypothetical protein
LHGIAVAQHDTDFAIPFIGEDIPLYVDPFLLWRSPSFQHKGLHQMLLGAFNHLGALVKSGAHSEAIRQLIVSSECDEVGLGTSATRSGHRIGEGQARDILSLFERIPYYCDHGLICPSLQSDATMVVWDPGDIAAWRKVIDGQSLWRISGHRLVGAAQQIGASGDKRVINALMRLASPKFRHSYRAPNDD